MDLQTLKNSEIEFALEKLFSLERRTTSRIVGILLEVDRRRLYFDYHYDGLFTFLQQKYGHSNGTAQRWVDAVRMAKRVPTLKQDLNSGEINLMQISLVARCLREKAKQSPNFVAEPNKLFSKIRKQGFVSSQRIVAEHLDLPVKSFESKRIQQDESVRFEITLTKEQMLKVNRAKELLSHQHPHLSMADYISVLTDAFVKKMDPELRSQRGKSIARKKTQKIEKKEEQIKEHKMEQYQKRKMEQINERKMEQINERKMEQYQERNAEQLDRVHKIIPVGLKRAIFQRDGCCRWKVGDQICGSKFQLQVDHVCPRWAGGGNEPSNLQILCAKHNRQKYRLEAGIQ